ncbi:midnolin isoform X2 [Bufo gargarizans]|uniref:midnolin isoform X2 n=1 Tax=Bufo gargarizans TaxID=30331 RepID=UPI001CF38900|nr:midnolin isoform X2 [Bufo gargarizans]
MEQQPSVRSCTNLGGEPLMNLNVHSTTGTRYELSVPLEETVDGLKRRISQKLKVPKERLTLLHRETRLSCGKLQDLGVVDGSRLTLLPTVEAGLMSQMSRPEQSVMQALESLTETQVNDFLSGRSPLTLALRVGDHMMFVQLQLAAQQAGGSQLQHHHLITRRPEHSAAPHFRTLHTSTTPVLSRLAGCTQGSPQPTESAPASSSHCNAPHSSSLTTSVFRSHGEGVAVSPCAEVPCSSSSTTTTTRSNEAGSPSQSARPRKPGAIIESFVNHAPGVFSGTFSGTLHPHCQDSTGRPRRDIGTILQILNDLLSATRHYQGMPPSLTTLRCHTQCASQTRNAKATSPQNIDNQQKSQPTVHSQPQARQCKPTGDRMRQTENRATRCKVERLQLLMHQKRLRRKARRDSRAPYQWLPTRKSSRTSSNSSTSSGEGALEMDFEDSLWKPDVKAELNSEFVVA